MCPVINIFGLNLPGYGLMIAIGFLLANAVAIFIIRKRKDLLVWDFIVTEALGLLGGFIGAKGLFLIQNINVIEWNRITEFAYFYQVIGGGFVFYGGFIGAFIFMILIGRALKVNPVLYIREFIFCFALAHGFGRIGCLLGGCCYGIPYEGPFSVIYPEGSIAPAGIPMFPVQLLEAFLLFAMFFIMFGLKKTNHLHYPVETYLLMYAIVRIITEALRYDAVRGHFLMLSTSQWISLGMLAYAAVSVIVKKTVLKKKTT